MNQDMGGILIRSYIFHDGPILNFSDEEICMALGLQSGENVSLKEITLWLLTNNNRFCSIEDEWTKKLTWSVECMYRKSIVIKEAVMSSKMVL